MLYWYKNREDLENLNQLVSLQNQVDELRLQFRLGKQNFLNTFKTLYEPLTDTIKTTSENLKKL